jgi:hypothetical protein
MTRIVTSLIDTDLIAGKFGGHDGFAPIGSVLRYSGTQTVATTAYALRSGDAGRLIETTSGSATSITVRLTAEVPFGDLTVITFAQMGAGKLTFVAADGVTIRTPETLSLAKQYAVATLIYKGSDIWLLVGNLEASA